MLTSFNLQDLVSFYYDKRLCVNIEVMPKIIDGNHLLEKKSNILGAISKWALTPNLKGIP